MLISVNRIFNCLNRILALDLNESSRRKLCVLSPPGRVVQTLPVSPSSMNSASGANLPWGGKARGCLQSQQMCVVKGTASNASLLGPHIQRRSKCAHRSCAWGCLYLFGCAGWGTGMAQPVALLLPLQTDRANQLRCHVFHCWPRRVDICPEMTHCLNVPCHNYIRWHL